MTLKLASFITALFLFSTTVHVIAQRGMMLPRSVPEAEGVSSDGIVNFLNAASKSKTEFHSFMLLRHGKVIAEGWWNPYGPTSNILYIPAAKVLQPLLSGLRYRKSGFPWMIK